MKLKSGKYRLLIPFFLFVCLFLFACQEKVIDEDRFVKLYSDLILSNETISGSSLSPDTVLQRTLTKYSVSLDEYKQTLEYYNEDSERWEKFFTKAVTYLEEKKKSLK